VDKIMRGEKRDANLALVRDLCEVLRDGSLCALGGLTPMPVLSALDHFPEDFDGKRLPAAAE
jgi:formate dehydrogenase iron-sulfur subunit